MEVGNTIINMHTERDCPFICPLVEQDNARNPGGQASSSAVTPPVVPKRKARAKRKDEPQLNAEKITELRTKLLADGLTNREISIHVEMKKLNDNLH